MSAANYPGLRYAKPETAQQRKARAKRKEQAHIRRVHAALFTLEGSCEICHGARQGASMGLPDQMHEIVPRSQTRGRPPEQRFNLENCARVCPPCHQDTAPTHQFGGRHAPVEAAAR